MKVVFLVLLFLSNLTFATCEINTAHQYLESRKQSITQALTSMRNSILKGFYNEKFVSNLDHERSDFKDKYLSASVQKLYKVEDCVFEQSLNQTLQFQLGRIFQQEMQEMQQGFQFEINKFQQKAYELFPNEIKETQKLVAECDGERLNAEKQIKQTQLQLLECKCSN